MAKPITTTGIQVLLPEGVTLTQGPTDNNDGTFSIQVTPSKDLFKAPVTVIYKGDAQTIPLSTKTINITKVESVGEKVGAGTQKKFTLTFDADIRPENVEWYSSEDWKLVKAPTLTGGNTKCELTLAAPTKFSRVLQSTIAFKYKGEGKTIEKTYQIEEFDNLFKSAEFKPATITNGKEAVCVLTFENYADERDYPNAIKGIEGLEFVSKEFHENTIKITYKATATGAKNVDLTCYEKKAMETTRRATLTVN